MLVRLNETFEVADHDFTKFSLITSVVFSVNIPHDVTLSWYTGQVSVGVKEGTFESSSPHRHVTELLDIVQTDQLPEKPLMFIYSDGEPDQLNPAIFKIGSSLPLCYQNSTFPFLAQPCRTSYVCCEPRPIVCTLNERGDGQGI